MRAAVEAAADRHESVGLMEPLLISDGSRHRAGLTDMALELAQRCAGFRRSLPSGLTTALAHLVREYDDLRVRLIVLNSLPNKDVQSIDDVMDRLAVVRAVLKYR